MKTSISILLLLISGIILWWLFSPIFIDNERQDELPAEIERQLNKPTEQQHNAGVSGTAPTPAQNTSSTDEAPTTFIDGPYQIIGTSNHPASGHLEVIYSPEETLLRYKNYDGTNDPDLKIYLAKDLEAREYLSLGDARGNEGTLIYGVPLDVDLDDYRYVLTWDEASGELFDYAEIR